MSGVTYPTVRSKITLMEKGRFGVRTDLACGHYTYLEEIDGQVVHVTSGVKKGKTWERWEGEVLEVGDDALCYTCQGEEKTRIIQARDPKTVERFESREALQEAHPGAQWHEYGPIHKHEGVLYVQVYLGQHEWIAVLLEDTRTCHNDPGWEGTEFGYGWVSEADLKDGMHLGCKDHLPPPESEGEPITVDQILFGR